jgi:hypothetical protein
MDTQLLEFPTSSDDEEEEVADSLPAAFLVDFFIRAVDRLFRILAYPSQHIHYLHSFFSFFLQYSTGGRR